MSLVTFNNKVNNPTLQAFFEQFGDETYLSAENINQMKDAINLMASLTVADGFIVKGTHGIVGSNYEINLNFKWIIDGITYENTIIQIFTIANASSGKNRYEIVAATKNNDFARFVGPEFTSIAVLPDVPEDCVELTRYVVTSAGAQTPIDPSTFSNFLEKAFLSNKTFNGSGVIETLAIDEKCSYLKLTGPITSFGGIQRISSNYVLGLPFFIEAAITGASMVIKHLEASPNVKFSFPDGLDFTLPKNHIAQFLPTFESGVFLHKFVGVSIGGGGGGGSTPKASTTFSGTTKTTTNEADPTVYTFQTTDDLLAEKQFKLTPDEGLEIDETIPEFPIIKLKPATTTERGGVLIFDDINSNGEFSYNANQVNAKLVEKADQATTYTKIEVNGLVSSTFKPKGSVANYASLPSTGQKEGDVWNLLDTGDNYVWVLNLNNTGIAGWDKLSGAVDLSAYQTAVTADSKYATIAQNNTKQDTLTDTNFAAFVNSTTTKDAIVDADKLGYFNSVNSKWVNTTWLKVVDYFKGYFQTKTQLITTATTATKGSKYIATGTFAVADFASPVQGDWHEVTVRNGTITVGGTDYKSGTIIKRIYDTTWKSYVYRQQLPIKISTGVTGTYDIDPTVSDEFAISLTGNTQLNFPNFSTVFSDVVSGNVSGNHGVTYELGTRVVGSYIGTATLNIFAVKKTNGVVTLSWTNYL